MCACASVPRRQTHEINAPASTAPSRGSAAVGSETKTQRAEKSSVQAKLTRRADPAVVRNSPSYYDPVTAAGIRAQGLYITGPFVKHFGATGVIHAVKGARLNAAVIDIKDDQARVTYRTNVDIYKPQSTALIKDMGAVVKALKQAGIYTIARVVCFNDDKLATSDPTRAILDGRPGKLANGPPKEPWRSWGTLTHWLDPYNKRNHQALLALIKEAASFGFDEVQLDYIRFPVDAGIQWAVFPARTEEPRKYVILDFIRQVDEALKIPISTDVFGLTAFESDQDNNSSVRVLGQSLEEWSAHVEIFSPMLYVNSMKSWGNHGDPRRAYQLVSKGIETLRKRLGPEPVIRPFLQAFPKGADHWDSLFIAEQVEATGQHGGDGFLFWHPGAHYKMVQAGMTGPARNWLPFKLAHRQTPSDQRQAENKVGEVATAPF